MHTASVSFDLSDTLAVLFPVWQLPHFSLQYCFMGSYRTQHTYASRAVKKGWPRKFYRKFGVMPAIPPLQMSILILILRR